ADLDPQAPELALRGDLQVLECLGVEEVGVRVEPVHHPVDGLLYELFVGNGLDVVALDPAEDGGQELQILVGNRQLCVALRNHREVDRQQNTQYCPQADQPSLLPVVHREISSSRIARSIR